MSINKVMGTRHYKPKPVNELECILGEDVPCDEVGSEFDTEAYLKLHYPNRERRGNEVDANRYLRERRRERPSTYVLRSTSTTIVTKLKVWAVIAMGLLGLAIIYTGT